MCSQYAVYLCLQYMIQYEPSRYAVSVVACSLVLLPLCFLVHTLPFCSLVCGVAFTLPILLTCQLVFWFVSFCSVPSQQTHPSADSLSSMHCQRRPFAWRRCPGQSVVRTQEREARHEMRKGDEGKKEEEEPVSKRGRQAGARQQQ